MSEIRKLKRVQYILSKVNDEDFLVKFDEFAQSILQTIEKSVRTSMAVNGDESSLEAYTLEWSRKLNRGGLFEVNDETYRFFREVEVKMQSILMAVLKRSVAASGQKQVIIDTVASDDDVQFFWALLTCDIQREEDAITLLKDIVELWLTIRGFSVAGAWLEQHKQKSRTNSRKSKGLRKKLSERAPETN